MNEKRKRRQFHILLVICMAVLVAAIDILFIIIPDRTESDTENRMLQQFPKMTWNTLTSGRFESQFDSYIADQFPFRDLWTGIESTTARLAGNTMQSGVFLSRDGYLILQFNAPSETEYREILSGFEGIAQKHSDLNIYALIAPGAESVLKDLLPANAFSSISGDEDLFLDRLFADIRSMGIDTVDTRDVISSLHKSGIQAYYRTDHHWTTDAAYEAYKCFAQAAGTGTSGTVYERKLLSDSFRGTLSASSGFRTKMNDEIYVYLPAEGYETEYVMMILDDGRKRSTVYDTSFLDTRDQYAVFMGGNHGQVKIVTAADTGRRLLLLKDSYANCFIPFLISDYDTIMVVDPRYYTGDIDQIIDNEEITDILFLYHAGTI